LSPAPPEGGAVRFAADCRGPEATPDHRDGLQSVRAAFRRAGKPVQSTKEFEERALNAFQAAFEAEYSGERRPLQLGFHFVEMNGGAYWRALERFAGEVCGQPEVACVSYQEAIDRMAPSSSKPDS
jgi:hypothetical protein